MYLCFLHLYCHLNILETPEKMTQLSMETTPKSNMLCGLIIMYMFTENWRDMGDRSVQPYGVETI